MGIKNKTSIQIFNIGLIFSKIPYYNNKIHIKIQVFQFKQYLLETMEIAYVEMHRSKRVTAPKCTDRNGQNEQKNKNSKKRNNSKLFYQQQVSQQYKKM